MIRCICLCVIALALCGVEQDQAAIYGDAFLLEEIHCAADVAGSADFSEYPEGGSQIQQILGQACRTLPNDTDEMKYMAWRLGVGKDLKAGAAYLIELDYPEDQARSMYVLNRGNETGMGLATGTAVADCLKGRYVNNSPESIQYPLSGKMKTYQMYFHLHDHFPGLKRFRNADVQRTERPADGFWFIVAQHKKSNAPLSQGAAVQRIRLYAVPQAKPVEIHYPPEELPRRYTFCREEMADTAAGVPHGKDAPEKRGVINPIDWFEYKARYMRFLGMNTFSKDLLEFGHNQGWPAHDNKFNNDWYIQSSTPGRWQRIVEMLANYDLYVLPMFEYGGSTGKHAFGKEKDFLSLKGNTEYTHIKWLENNAHADILDPRCLEELKEIFRRTIVRHKDIVPFVGAWLRPRPMQMPMNFNDKSLARFNAETSHNCTREHLAADARLLQAYYAWWFDKRQQLTVALNSWLEQELGRETCVLFTSDSTEPGQALPKRSLVTDQTDVWQTVLKKAGHDMTVRSFHDVVSENLHAQACASPTATWGDYEVHHASPWADPLRYKHQRGSLQTLTYHRLYAVSNPTVFDEFRSQSGLGIIRHHSLNENEMEGRLGYFVCDVERAGPYCMLKEARALAYGDPRYLGFLISNTLTRGFPYYVRQFNQAFLSLPAIPSTLLDNVSSDKEVLVRQWQSEEHGTWIAIINVSLMEKRGVSVRLPKHVVFAQCRDECFDAGYGCLAW